MAPAPFCVDDSSFGPVVQGCRDGFDFTVKFERIILSIVPSSIFIVAAILRCYYLLCRRRARVARSGTFQFSKLATTLVFCALALAHLVLYVTGHGVVARHLSVAAAALVLASGVCMIPLSFMEHQLSSRPSTTLISYLFLSALCNIVQIRTAWLSRDHVTRSVLATAMLGFKVLILVLESVEKPKWLLQEGEKQPVSREETSSIFNLGVFFWLNDLFLRGYSSLMTVNDLYPLDKRMHSSLLHYRLMSHSSHLSSERPHGLTLALAQALARPLLAPIFPRIAYIGFTFAQPFFISALVAHLQQDQQQERRDSLSNQLAWENRGKGLIGAAVFIYVGTAVSQSFYRYLVQQSLYKARGCLVSSIFEKTTRTSISTAVNKDSTAAVTLMSTDMERVVKGFLDMHEIWANPIEIGLGCWMLQQRLGLAFLSPVVVISICLAIMTWVGKTAGVKQTAWMGKIQIRVGVTATAISHLKRLRIAGLDEAVGSRIRQLRVEDLDIGSKFRFLQALAAVVAYAPQCLSPIFAFAFGGKDLDVDTMYTALSFLVILTTPLATFFQSIPVLLGGMACLDRINAFLVAEPRQDFRLCTQRPLDPSYVLEDNSGTEVPRGICDYEMSSNLRGKNGRGPVLSICEGSYGWEEGRVTLKNIDLSLQEGQITMIIGPVASGKSTLCKAVLGEVPFARGCIKFHFRISGIAFCDQSPFIAAGTILENIVRYDAFDNQRYQEVLRATALDIDLQTLPDGDKTHLESGGVSLSGGQKNRLALATALYQRCSLLVLDDVLSGLDRSTETLVLQRCFGPRGLVRLRGITALLATHSSRHLRYADHVIALDQHGGIAQQGPSESVKGDSGSIFTSDDDSESDSTAALTQPDTETHSRNLDPSPGTPPSSNALDDALDDQSRQTGDRKVYKIYLKSIGVVSLLQLLLCGFAFGFGSNFPTLWIGIWSQNALNRSFSFYIGIYALTRSMLLIAVMASAVLVLVVVVRASGIQLHQATLDTVLNAPVSVQTAMNVGKVTNLFSQDMTILDSELPISFLNLSVGMFGVLGMVIVMAVASPWLALSYPALFALLWLIQKFYLRTSRQLRLLDLEAKTPLYAHFLETIRGIATIRAYGWSDAEISRHYALLDTSQRPAYLLVMAQQWLILTLDLVVAVIAIMLTALASQLRANSGFTGASLVTLMTFGKELAGLVRAYTQLETSIGAISRLRTFSEKVPREGRIGEDLEPPFTWPERGTIELNDISASYSSSAQDPSPTSLALCNASLNISAGENVAICGRTGSGKSSLVLLLLRLLDPLDSSKSSSFSIDGTSVRSLQRAALRQRIIAVPQDCVFLQGSSIKNNLDISGTFSDAECQAVVEQVRLSSFVEAHGGLGGPLIESQLSAGQKQLFSMARAILRRRHRDRLGARGGILLLDEVSSSVDDETEQLMHELVQSYFRSYTVIMVAHRLRTLSEYVDKVVVMDSGRIVETGPSSELLAREDGWFRRLVRPQT